MPRNTPPSLISYTEIVYNATTTPRTSASISWSTGDVIVVVAGDESSATLNAPTATGLTFTLQKSNNTGSGTTCQTGVWTAVAASSGSGGITGGRGATTANWGMSIWVWRGSDGVGVSFEQHTNTNTISATPTDTHSAFCWGVFDFNTGSVRSIVPTPTNTRDATIIGTAYTIYVADWDDDATSTAQSFGVSGAATAGPWSIIGVEVLGTTSGSGTPAPAAAPSRLMTLGVGA